MAKIHPSAVVEDGAQIAQTAEIGPFAGLVLVQKSAKMLSCWLV